MAASLSSKINFSFESDSLPPTRPLPLLVLRYEELTSDRAAVLQRLYDFLYAGGAADAAPAYRTPWRPLSVRGRRPRLRRGREGPSGGLR